MRQMVNIMLREKVLLIEKSRKERRKEGKKGTGITILFYVMYHFMFRYIIYVKIVPYEIT